MCRGESILSAALWKLLVLALAAAELTKIALTRIRQPLPTDADSPLSAVTIACT